MILASAGFGAKFCYGSPWSLFWLPSIEE